MNLIKKKFPKNINFLYFKKLFKKIYQQKKIRKVWKKFNNCKSIFPSDFASTGQLIEELTNNLRNENFK